MFFRQDYRIIRINKIQNNPVNLNSSVVLAAKNAKVAKIVIIGAHYELSRFILHPQFSPIG